MPRVAILYGTTEGHTAKIAQRIGAEARTLGHQTDVLHIGELDDDFTLSPYAGAIVGASVHEGRHQRYVERFVEHQREWLRAHPSAFFSVCLVLAGGDAQSAAEARQLIDRFLERTGWHPTHAESFAGALKYTQYNWLKRMLMKHIVGGAGGDTDTSQDYEYTDWSRVDRFAHDALAPLSPSPHEEAREAGGSAGS